MNISPLLEALERELQNQVSCLSELAPFHEMLTYHMGWSGEGAGPQAQGKRIRPILLLLTASACGGDWQAALPLAAAVELVHNFSLIHDDIQDRSPLRRGRPTLWSKWGIAQAINAGDAMFILAQRALLSLRSDAERIVRLARIFQDTCLDLTRGQFLDLSYESQGEITLEEYWRMIAGKTAALLSAATWMGAIFAGAEEEVAEAYREFGHYLGLAFQVQDDYLGIWGNEVLTGKSAASDLLSGKKTLPVVFGLAQDGVFAARWRKGNITSEEVPFLAEQLVREGAQAYTLNAADQMTDLAIQAIRRIDPAGEAGEEIYRITRALLLRQA
ncbi:MAG: polyprenyl synthetase family protein [Anaerolineales bacterium]